ncbi:MAG: ABC transporter permease [Eubacteriales bacterium]|jgi:simple sugar transport system permease protein|nr:ABC transporter permease [Eubacteriales bacterium]MDD4135253.1 ABC transporter permease [Eubacteriales bacterium]NLO13215.1 ABC transporter permease [Clostridiales bacterium]
MTSLFDQFLAFLYAAVLAAVPLLYGTLGEILTQKAGNINLGVEGMMYLGAIAGFAVGYATSSPALVLLAGFLAGALGALLYAFITVTLKANQNVTGLTLTVFGTGVANFIGEQIKTHAPVGTAFMSEGLKAGLTPLRLGALSELPVVGRLLFSHSVLTYLAVLCAILMGLYLNRSRRGLNLRAVGENPAAADAMGVPVALYKYAHILVGGGLSGLGGVYISMVTCLGNWQPNIVAGQGWIAVALVIFAVWRPLRAVLGSLVFGALSVLRLYISKDVVDIPAAIFSMLPFAVTCLVLVISSIRMKPEHCQPGSCGANYFREER